MPLFKPSSLQAPRCETTEMIVLNSWRGRGTDRNDPSVGGAECEDLSTRRPTGEAGRAAT